jgi:hypothetical protein
MSSLGIGFDYDAFISYRQVNPDKTWVAEVLIPRLEAQAFRVCVDYRDFRLGAAIVQEIARAVEESRYTVAILSPVYLASNFTELENVLAEHLGLENGQRRLIAIMREPCTPRLGVRHRLWLDMTEDSKFDLNFAQLAAALREAPDK